MLQQLACFSTGMLQHWHASATLCVGHLLCLLAQHVRELTPAQGMFVTLPPGLCEGKA